MEQHSFQEALNNYRYGVQQLIPAYLSGQMTDEEAYVDELALVLQSRDELERAFATSPRLWQEYGAQVEELDRRLLAMREAILERTADYATFRRHLPRPRSHWWYYLGEIVSVPLSPALSSEHPDRLQGYWMPLVASGTTP